jgi:peptide/nickel transport system substrate-binding protein
VAASIRSVASEAALQAVRDRDFDTALVEIELTADPDPYPLWHSTQAESGQNFAGFANDDADRLMEEARQTADPEELLELYHAFQEIFAEEVPSLLLYYPVYVYAVDGQVRNVQIPPLLHSSDRFRNVQEWYTETEQISVSEGGELDKSGE